MYFSFLYTANMMIYLKWILEWRIYCVRPVLNKPGDSEISQFGLYVILFERNQRKASNTIIHRRFGSDFFIWDWKLSVRLFSPSRWAFLFWLLLLLLLCFNLTLLVDVLLVALFLYCTVCDVIYFLVNLKTLKWVQRILSCYILCDTSLSFNVTCILHFMNDGKK